MRSANECLAGFIAACLSIFHCAPLRKPCLHILTLVVTAPVLMIFSCATPHATLDVTAPSAVTAGTAFTITVTALYQGQQDTVINSYVQFTSSDKAAILPHYYRFTPSDAGVHSFPGVRLKTPGNQTITATILMATGINGTATVTVSGPNSTGLE